MTVSAWLGLAAAGLAYGHTWDTPIAVTIAVTLPWRQQYLPVLWQIAGVCGLYGK